MNGLGLVSAFLAGVAMGLLDVAVPGYDVSPAILLPLLGAILALLSRNDHAIPQMDGRA